MKKKLSPRQNEFAILLSQGKSNPEIAREMNIALSTADTYIRELSNKLGVSVQGRGVREAIVAAYQEQILGRVQ